MTSEEKEGVVGGSAPSTALDVTSVRGAREQQTGTNAPDLRAAFLEHADDIRRFVERVGVSAQEAEDLMADTFVIAHKKIGSFDPSRSMRPWLFGIAANLARSHRRRSWIRRIALVAFGQEPQSPQPSADTSLVRQESVMRVHRVLAKMPEKKRMLLVLKELQELSTNEIAEALSMRPGSVHSALHYARKEFLRLYRQQLVVEEP